MLIEHRGKVPSVHDSAYVAPTAVLCGDVVVGPGSRVLHGAVLTAEDGQVRVGRDVVIMENAVVKGRAGHPVVIGDFVLVGPHAHVNGAEVRAGAFIATGASLFPGSVVGSGAEIRVNGVVQVNTTVDAGSVVPIGWVAVGTPATVRPPDQHRDIWAIQRDLDFPGTVYGVPRGASMRVIMEGQSAFYGAHLEDVVLGTEEPDDELPADVGDGFDGSDGFDDVDGSDGFDGSEGFDGLTTSENLDALSVEHDGLDDDRAAPAQAEGAHDSSDAPDLTGETEHVEQHHHGEQPQHDQHQDPEQAAEHVQQADEHAEHVDNEVREQDGALTELSDEALVPEPDPAH